MQVLAICPGSVATDFSRDAAKTNRRHITQAEDVADSI